MMTTTMIMITKHAVPRWWVQRWSWRRSEFNVRNVQKIFLSNWYNFCYLAAHRQETCTDVAKGRRERKKERERMEGWGEKLILKTQNVWSREACISAISLAEDPQYYDTKFEEAVGNVKGGRSVMSASFHRLRATDYHTNIATCHWLPHKHRHVQMSSLFARVGNDRLAPCGTEDNKFNCLSSEYRSTTAIEQNIVAWRFTSLTKENEFLKKNVCVCVCLCGWVYFFTSM